jgi:nitroreductase
VPGNQAWAKAAPLLLATVASSKFAANGSANRWAQYDSGAAALAVALQASALSLQAHQMGGFDTERLRQSFAIPAGYEPMAMMAIGYPGAPAQLSEKSQLTETKPRERRAIETFAYRGRWGLPWT